jgi:N-acetylmuramoyl-L-alanine amidase
MQGLVVRLLAAMAAVAALTAIVAVAQVPRPVAIDLGPVRALVPALERPEGRLLSLKGVGAALGWRLAPTEDGGFELEVDPRAEPLRFPAEIPAIVQGPMTFWSLGAETLRVDEDLFLTRDAVGAVRLAGEALVQRAGSSSTVPRLRLEASSSSAGEARLWLTVTGGTGALEGEPAVRWDEPTGRWNVRLPPGFDTSGWPWRSQQVGHPLLQAVSLGDDGGASRIVLHPGPEPAEVTARPDADGGGWRIALAARADARPGSRARSSRPRDEESREVRRIVLDPGHGGEEDGAIGRRGVVEKELVLDVSRRVRAKLRTRGFEVKLTREGDVGLPLDARAGIANREKADLFVSIHANAARYRGARGAETYFLAREATDDAARTAAALENNASRARLEGTRDGDLPLILWDMAQTEYLEESQQLAELIQARLNERVNMDDRGVRQAPFRVLVGATCPAVLVELGFLSHPEEEKLLEQPSYRDRLALALAEAVEGFARAREGSEPGAGWESSP